MSSYDLAVLLVTTLAISLFYLLIERTRIGIAFRAVSAQSLCQPRLRSEPAPSACVLVGRRRPARVGRVAADRADHVPLIDQLSPPSCCKSFAAAVVGGFSSLPGAVVGGIFIGVLMNLLSFYVAGGIQLTPTCC